MPSKICQTVTCDPARAAPRVEHSRGRAAAGGGDEPSAATVERCRSSYFHQLSRCRGHHGDERRLRGGDHRRGHRQEGEPAGSKVKADASMSRSYFSYSPRRSKGAIVDGLRRSGRILRHEAGQGRCRDVRRGQAGAAPGCWARPLALATR
jgi:hypothetical protein